MVSTFFKALTLAVRVKNYDDEWEYTEEPHVSRRQAILEKHPEIKKLMGYDPTIAIYVSMTVVVQICIAGFLSWLNPGWFVWLICTYCLSGTLNHSLGSAIHEIGHNLAFGHKRGSANRVLSLVANLPMGIPMAISYKKYHQDHHRWLGHDHMDVDIPTQPEIYLFNNFVTKTIWLFFFPVIHAIRPFLKSPKPVTYWELVNFAVQFSFDFIIYQAFGIKALLYYAGGTFLGLGIHPLSGHFISEHFLFSNNQATHSYYGPLNYLMYNLGYHVEHHDFPYIPCTRLAKVREIAPEFYEHIPYHSSWTRVVWDFLWQSKMGPGARSITQINQTKPEMYKDVPEVHLAQEFVKETNGDVHDKKRQ